MNIYDIRFLWSKVFLYYYGERFFYKVKSVFNLFIKLFIVRIICI